MKKDELREMAYAEVDKRPKIAIINTMWIGLFLGLNTATMIILTIVTKDMDPYEIGDPFAAINEIFASIFEAAGLPLLFMVFSLFYICFSI